MDQEQCLSEQNAGAQSTPSRAVPFYYQSWGDLLYLVMCALEGEVADEDAVAKMDLYAVLRAAKDHSMAALASAPLLALWESRPTDEAVMAPWERADAKAAYRYLLFANEQQQISDWMEDQGIWHMPLKGSVLCTSYPSPHLRECRDVDMLFDASYRDKLRCHMEEQGYTFSTFAEHDIYTKEPVYNFEMHRGLVHHPTLDRAWADFYENTSGRLVPVAGRMFERRFSHEDFYVHTIMHAVQHLREGGIGVRVLADLGVMLNAWEEELDWQRVDSAVERLGLVEYERLWRSPAIKLFTRKGYQQSMTEDEFNMLATMLDSGTFGNPYAVLRRVVNDGRTNPKDRIYAKLAYVKRRTFPSYKDMSLYRENLQAHPWLLPFYWAKRIVDVLGSRGWRHELRRVIDL